MSAANRTRGQHPVDPELVEFCEELTRASRNIVARYFRQAVSIDAKGDQSPVTVADQEVEACWRERIAARYPAHGILGEEFGAQGRDREYLWVLDPIDGTRSFINGTPTFGSLIAVLHRGAPVFGVIDMPALDECWMGGSGYATCLNGAPVRVSACEQVDQCRLTVTAPQIFNAAQSVAFERVLSRTSFYRYGGDCYNYALLAAGYTDLVVEADLKPHDFCALVPVIENAGGVITDWCGDPLTLDSGGEVLAAATPALHAEVVSLLGSH